MFSISKDNYTVEEISEGSYEVAVAGSFRKN